MPSKRKARRGKVNHDIDKRKLWKKLKRKPVLKWQVTVYNVYYSLQCDDANVFYNSKYICPHKQIVAKLYTYPSLPRYMPSAHYIYIYLIDCVMECSEKIEGIGQTVYTAVTR